MTRRALLWCGWADPARVLDFPASVKDLDLAVRAARALGVRDMDMHAFLSHADLISDPEVSQHAATIDALERVVASLAREATADDALLFIATNHGEQLGLLTSGPVDEFSSDEDMPRHLSPAILRQCLDKIPGTQVMIFATCHAGGLSSLGAREPNSVGLLRCGPGLSASGGSSVFPLSDRALQGMVQHRAPWLPDGLL